MDVIAEHEHMLTKDLLTKLLAINEVAVVGPLTMESRGGAVSFTVAGIHPHDLGQFLDSQGIAVRTGHHCAWPLTRSLGVPATTRASLYLYNTIEDNDALIDGIESAMRYFK
jgi:cysteine desulfurase/selenocysteine lyase